MPVFLCNQDWLTGPNTMNDTIIWIIIIAFYAPLHFMLPVLILFITGNEGESARKSLIRLALIDSTLSLLFAFMLAIVLVKMDLMIWGMLALLISMFIPLIRIIRQRKQTAH
jgi:hypothetical protein